MFLQRGKKTLKKQDHWLAFNSMSQHMQFWLRILCLYPIAPQSLHLWKYKIKIKALGSVWETWHMLAYNLGSIWQRQNSFQYQVCRHHWERKVRWTTQIIVFICIERCPIFQGILKIYLYPFIFWKIHCYSHYIHKKVNARKAHYLTTKLVPSFSF